MPIVSTDDQARRLRYIYLGPVGFRLPFDARFPAIGMWMGVAFVLGLLSYTFAPAGTHLGRLGAIVAPLVAIVITRRVMRHVDHDRPLRWWAATLFSNELRTPRPITNGVTTHTRTTPTNFFHGSPHDLAVPFRAKVRATVRHRTGR